MHRINNYFTATWNAPAHIKTLITTRIPPHSVNTCGDTLDSHLDSDLHRNDEEDIITDDSAVIPNNRAVIPDLIRDPGVGMPTHQSTFGFNVATHVNDNLANVIRNRNLLNTFLPSPPHWLNQIHSNKVLNLDTLHMPSPREHHGIRNTAIPDKGVVIPDRVLDPVSKIPDACLTYDASITHTPNKVCVVMTADCLPILLTDTDGSFVASIHAGRAGLANNIIANTVRASQVAPDTILAYIGPAICQKHYEVGEEIFAEFITQNTQNKRFFTQKFHCDLVGIARLQLLDLGLSEEHIHTSSSCTYCRNDRFYSYRKENITGRFASLIWSTT